MATLTVVSPDVLTDVARERARGEARQVTTMLAYRDAEIARTETVEPPMRRLVERAGIAVAIGEATGLSEGQVQYQLSVGTTVRDQTPRVWEAFTDGLVDLARVRDIAATVDKLQRPESIALLDEKVLGYAAGHTTAELRQWLRRFVQRVEADLATERAESERRDRHVRITHGQDGMSWLNAYLPSHQAATIENRLRKEARKPVADPDDDRTVGQREADLLVAWCTDSDATTSVLDANIAVTVDADVLAGVVAGFAESADGRWAVPAGWVTDITKSGNTFWHRIITEPVTGDVLSHEYLGRFAPDVLKVALQYLHEVCQAPGCMVPAARCDIDHQNPYPEGPTAASNLGPLCRRHHILKGHGILHWTTHPPPAPPLVIEIYQDPINIEYAA